MLWKRGGWNVREISKLKVEEAKQRALENIRRSLNLPEPERPAPPMPEVVKKIQVWDPITRSWRVAEFRDQDVYTE